MPHQPKAPPPKPLHWGPAGLFALKGVVTYDNIRLEQEFEAHRLDQGGAQGVRDAFRKKSKVGIRTPKPEIDLIAARLVRLRREMLP